MDFQLLPIHGEAYFHYIPAVKPHLTLQFLSVFFFCLLDESCWISFCLPCLPHFVCIIINISFFIALIPIGYKSIYARSISYRVLTFILRKVVANCFQYLHPFNSFHVFSVMLGPHILHSYSSIGVMGAWKRKSNVCQSLSFLNFCR